MATLAIVAAVAAVAMAVMVAMAAALAMVETVDPALAAQWVAATAVEARRWLVLHRQRNYPECL